MKSKFCKKCVIFTKNRQNDVKILSYIVKNNFLRFLGHFTICVKILSQLKHFWRFWFFWSILIDLCWFYVNFHFKMVIKSWKMLQFGWNFDTNSKLIQGMQNININDITLYCDVILAIFCDFFYDISWFSPKFTSLFILKMLTLAKLIILYRFFWIMCIIWKLTWYKISCT